VASASEASQQANRSGMDPKRLTIVFYLLAGIVFALFLDQILLLAWEPLGWPNSEVVEGLGWRVTTLLGLGLSAAAVITCFAHPRVREISLDVASELMKVSWPPWDETRASTLAVVVASVVAAAILYVIDLGALQLMVSWLPALWEKL
jgi:preprotein translocase subunit SecE